MRTTVTAAPTAAGVKEKFLNKSIKKSEYSSINNVFNVCIDVCVSICHSALHSRIMFTREPYKDTNMSKRCAATKYFIPRYFFSIQINFVA